MGQNEKRIHDIAKGDISEIECMNVLYKFQKNMDNGQEITYKKDKVNSYYCPVKAWLRIVKREKFKVKKSQPVAFFKGTDKARKFVTAGLVNKVLRNAAKEVLDITDKNDLENRLPTPSG